jgi:8-oxo-dGTP pyrophosphatase MutT (NUDIX family)
MLQPGSSSCPICLLLTFFTFFPRTSSCNFSSAHFVLRRLLAVQAEDTVTAVINYQRKAVERSVAYYYCYLKASLWPHLAMYRPNVCCFIFNEKVEFLGCQRIKSEHYQCVQGGIEKRDDDVTLAAFREIEEEIGLKPEDLCFVQEIPPPNGDAMNFAYELSAHANLRRFGYIGQKQRILLFFTPSSNIEKVVLVPPPELHALQEFRKVAWMPIEELTARSLPEKAHIFRAVSAVAPDLARAFLRSKGLLPAASEPAKY